MDTLYKIDSKGRTRSLEIRVEGDELVQVSGLVDGKKVTHRKQRFPKNIGKKNETTGEQQAELEAKALFKKKIREGYTTDANVSKEDMPVLPMLAYDYFKHIHKHDGKKLFYQPKLDGIRCLMFYNHNDKSVTSKSRKNVSFDNLEFLEKDIKYMCRDIDRDIVFDGELYRQDLTFQECTKLVKNPHDDKNSIEYHVYDMIDEDLTFEERYNYLKDNFKDPMNFIHLVPTNELDISKIEDIYSDVIDAGYEGLMVRVADSKYTINKRSDKLLKYKKFIDIALPIEAITPNDANPKHGTVWVRYKGHLQKTGAKLPHADREELLLNKRKLVGKMAEIRFFEETDEGLMRFPVYHGIRIDK